MQEVLPVVLRRDSGSELTEEDVLIATFLHATNLYQLYSTGEFVGAMGANWANFGDWFSGERRKIVKRAKSARFNELANDKDAVVTVVDVLGKEVSLLSFPPYDVKKVDSRVKSLRVSYLTLGHRSERVSLLGVWVGEPERVKNVTRFSCVSEPMNNQERVTLLVNRDLKIEVEAGRKISDMVQLGFLMREDNSSFNTRKFEIKSVGERVLGEVFVGFKDTSFRLAVDR